MKKSDKITAMWFLTLFMCLGVVALCILIYQDFGPHLYEDWGHELAVAMENFSNATAGN